MNHRASSPTTDQIPACADDRRARRAARVGILGLSVVLGGSLTACVVYQQDPPGAPPAASPTMPVVTPTMSARAFNPYLERCDEANGTKVCSVIVPPGESTIDLTLMTATEVVVGGARMDDALSDSARFVGAQGASSTNIEPVIEQLQAGFARVSVNNTDTAPLRIIIGAHPTAGDDGVHRGSSSISLWGRGAVTGLRALRNAVTCGVVREIYTRQGMVCEQAPWYLPNIGCWKQHLLCAHLAS